MSGGAYGVKAQDTEFRKKWDKEEYNEKAKLKDQEERERMQENEERLKQGAFNKYIPMYDLHLCHFGCRKETSERKAGRPSKAY